MNSCASRVDNSKFYYSLHLPLPDLPSSSLLLGLHRASKDIFVSTTFLQSKQDDSDGSSVAIEKDAKANISIAINGLRKNVAFLTVLQTTNYVLGSQAFAHKSKQILLVSKVLIIYCLVCATEKSFQKLVLRASSGYLNTSKHGFHLFLGVWIRPDEALALVFEILHHTFMFSNARSFAACC